MKKLLFLITFVFSGLVSYAQTTTSTEIVKVNDSTYVESTITTDEDGFVVSTQNRKFSLDEFAEVLALTRLTTLAAADRKEALIAQERNEANKLRRFGIDSLGVNFDSIQVAIMANNFAGEYKIVERNGTNSTNELEIKVNPNNPKNFRIKETTGDERVGTVTITHFEAVKLKNFFDEDDKVEFFIRPNGNWRGKLADGTVVILKKQTQ